MMPPVRTVTCLLFLCVPALWPSLPAAATANPAVRVDQVGYLPSETKFGAVTGTAATGAFDIRRVSDNASVFSGTLAAAFGDGVSADNIREADFSAVTATGSYYLDVAGVGASHPFDIGPEAFRDAFIMAMKGFYGQRCGTAVTIVSRGVTYSHFACHSLGACNDLLAVFHSSTGRTGTLNSGKGWHDAGDYGKYVVNSGISTGELLWAYEFFHDRIGTVDTGIPESGDATPDILDEARWNLEWMLTMQDSDGGVWHKNTSAGFGGFVLPEFDDAETRYIIGRGPGAGQAPYKLTCATADFAAVMAVAARLFTPFDASFAVTCLTASQNAWTWAQANPNSTYTSQPTGISTGAYGDNNCSDELLWAAAELFRTTGGAAYSAYVTGHTSVGTLFTSTAIQGWNSVRNLALWTYAFAPGADAALRARIESDTLTAAGGIASRTNGSTNGYKNSLTEDQYYWGSNGVVADYGVFLLVANALSPDPAFTNAALNNLHYLLGRNTHNTSFVTHVGDNPFQHPHHRPSGSPQYSYRAPWPGLLSGGPNSSSYDGSSLDSIPAYPPAKRWVDQTASYASNEVAINWQAPLVFLLASTLPILGPTATPTPTLSPTSTPTRSPTPIGTWYTPTATPTPGTLADILLFPNPVVEGNIVKFRTDFREPVKSLEVRVYTVASRLLVKAVISPVESPEYRIELRDEYGAPLSNGLYYVLFKSGSQSKWCKLLVLH